MSISIRFYRRNSGRIARERLKLMLTAERADCPLELLEVMKQDMIQSISRHMEIDADAFEIHIDHKNTIPASMPMSILCIGVPLKNRKKAGDRHIRKAGYEYISKGTKIGIQVGEL